MEKIALSGLLSLSLISIAWANESHYECPSITAIQQIGLSNDTYQESDGNYMVSQKDYYGTSHAWTFRVRNIAASSSAAAVIKAVATLPTLSGNPESVYMNGYMDCQYDNRMGYFTDAYTKYIGK